MVLKERIQVEHLIIVGSGKSAIAYKDWDLKENQKVLVMNNAFKLRDDWDYWCSPTDLKDYKIAKKIVDSSDTKIHATPYGPSIKRFGGHGECGNTTFFNSSYWALDWLIPKFIGYIGCDMDYYQPGNEETNTFYGKGTPDPLLMVKDIEKKFEKLSYHAQRQNCKLYNHSLEGFTKLPFERVPFNSLV